MSHVIVFHILDGYHGQWSLKECRGPFESLDTAKEKLREWGYSEQKGYEIGNVRGVWLLIQEHTRNVPNHQPQYLIIKAQVCEIKPG